MGAESVVTTCGRNRAEEKDIGGEERGERDEVEAVVEVDVEVDWDGKESRRSRTNLSTEGSVNIVLARRMARR